MNNDFSQLYYTEHNIKQSMHGHLSIKYACGKPIPELKIDGSTSMH